MQRTRSILTMAAVAAAFLVGWVVAPTMTQSIAVAADEVCEVPPTDPPVDPVPVSTIPDVSGTIRWVNNTTWTVLNDAGHTPEGIASVQMMTDRVRVHFTFTATKVSSFQATPDEAFASADVRVGASVSYAYADIYFYMPASGSTPVNPALLSKAGANVWLTGWFITE